jgi:nitrogen fixation-related uncharacterized protein
VLLVLAGLGVALYFWLLKTRKYDEGDESDEKSIPFSPVEQLKSATLIWSAEAGSVGKPGVDEGGCVV